MRKLDPLVDPHHLIRPHYLPDTVGSAVLGLALLLAGQRLFWLFVGALGFITATEYIVPSVAGNDPGVALIIGLIAGLAGALFAIFVQKFAVGLAGAIAGAYYLNILLDAGALRDPAYAWLSTLVGAVLGALLFLMLFKWMLIIFSSVVGAHLIVRTFVHELPPAFATAGFILLVIVGIGAQSRLLSRSRD